jgi:hypothetical protein
VSNCRYSELAFAVRAIQLHVSKTPYSCGLRLLHMCVHSVACSSISHPLFCGGTPKIFFFASERTKKNTKEVVCEHSKYFLRRYIRLGFTIRSALFWGLTQRRMVILYRRFGTHTLSRNEDYHPTLLKTPEERRSHQHRGGSPKSRIGVT